MQLGFNTNFRYRDVVFHVQTEDSGRANPHVITHVFHGGNIIASLKSDYSDLLGEADLEAAVRKLMESQHKSMLKQLSRGEFDRAISERLGPEIFPPGDAGQGAAPSRVGSDSETGSAATDRTPGIERPAKPPRTPAAPPAAPSGSSASSTPLTPARAAAERTVVTPPARETTSGLARVFGDRVISEKPLDEVVLDYLVENARKRKRQPKP